MGRVIPDRRRRRWLLPAALCVAVVAVAAAVWTTRHPGADLSGPSPTWTATPGSTRSPAPKPATAPTPGYDRARSLLAALPVKGWDRERNFVRSRFGEPWSDEVNVEFGHNGCDTRDDILRRDLADLVVRPGTCYAQSGVLHDPYTGQTIAFTRGPSTSDAVQIDHVVSLSDAWYKGASNWDDQRRRDFANDPRNLLAVGSHVNFDKAFRDAAAWLPPVPGLRCGFVARQVEVKASYRLWVSEKEKESMAEVLRGC